MPDDMTGEPRPIIDLAEARARKHRADMQEGGGRPDKGETPRRPIPADWQRVLDKIYALNGLIYQPFFCEGCGHHLFDSAVLLGVVRKKCPVCKFPNEQEFNRVGEEQIQHPVREKMLEQRERARLETDKTA